MLTGCSDACVRSGPQSGDKAIKLTDYAAHDALGLAALVKSKEVTAEELLACALEAAEALDGDLNAIVRSMEAEARATIPDFDG